MLYLSIMKHITLYTNLIIVTLFTASCIKFAANFELTETDPQIVINGILEPDSLFKVHVCRSISILESNEKVIPIEGAIVEVFENGKLIDQLDQYQNGFYKSSSLKPLPQSKYTIKVTADDFETAHATIKIPSNEPVMKIDTATKTFIYNSEHEERNLELSIEIKNNPNEKNFYMVEAYIQNWGYMYEYDEQANETVDSGYFYSSMYVTTKSPYAILGFSDYSSWIEKFSSTDENYEGTYSAQKIIFSDEYMNQSTEKINLWVWNQIYDYDNKLGKTIPLKIYVYEVSQEFIYYLKSHSTYFVDPFSDFFVEKNITYCNIENGMGIMASMASQQFIFNIPVLEPIEIDGNFDEEYIW